jgi:hypothetical protein
VVEVHPCSRTSAFARRCSRSCSEIRRITATIGPMNGPMLSPTPSRPKAFPLSLE